MPKFYRQNKKKINPRYFLHETTEDMWMGDTGPEPRYGYESLEPYREAGAENQLNALAQLDEEQLEDLLGLAGGWARGLNDESLKDHLTIFKDLMQKGFEPRQIVDDAIRLKGEAK